MESHQSVNLAEFISVAVSVAEASGMVMRRVYESGDLQKKNKGDENEDDPVTIADFTVQKTIMTCFKEHFPNLRCEGEESPEDTKNI